MLRIKDVLRENTSWLVLALSFFVLGFWLSFTYLQEEPAVLNSLEEAIVPVLSELGNNVFYGNPLSGAFQLFIFNLSAALRIIFLGVILGIPSLFSVLLNGTVLGVVAVRFASEGINPVTFFLYGILPHGILEIPALLVSAAMGLKLGYHLVFPLPQKGRLETLKTVFREVNAVLPAIVMLLAAAALLEVLVTPGLVETFLTR